jgi:DNA-binding LacI/PurR family transcriptional regulator
MVLEPTRPPVMGDVARLAGVSHQTVSRVVNGHPHIRAETKARVLRAIEQLGYRPNTAARALVRGRSGIVGVVSASSPFFGPRSAEHAVRSAARAKGYAVATVDLGEVTREGLVDALEDLARLGVEGVIVVAGHDDAVEAARARPGDVPVVVVEGDLSRTPMTVGVDQFAGAVAAVRHLVALGHRRIIHLAGPQDWAEARARTEGWRAAMSEAGLPTTEPLVGDWTAASGYAAGRAIAADPTVSAVFASNDQMALGVLRALHEEGRRVPGTVSVVGFDDLPEAEYFVPSLTTVRQDFDAVGVRALDLLDAAIHGETPPPVPLVIPALVVRASTAPSPFPRTGRETAP